MRGSPARPGGPLTSKPTRPNAFPVFGRVGFFVDPATSRPTDGAGVSQAPGNKHGGIAMLVLSRKREEAVVVGVAGDGAPLLTVTVLEVVGTQVKLGFQADATVLIHR